MASSHRSVLLKDCAATWDGRLHPARTQDIWVGTDAGLSHYVDGRFEFLAPQFGLENVRVRTVMEDRTGALWFGTQGRGAYRYQDGKLTEYSVRTGLSGNLRQSHHPGLRKVASSSVRTRASTSSRTARSLPPVPAIAALGAITTSILYEDTQRRLWIATDAHGLYVLAHGTLKRYNRANGLPADRAIAIEDDGRGGLWIGTTGGIARIRDGKAESLARGIGPQSETVIQILRDRYDTLWLSTNRRSVRNRGKRSGNIRGRHDTQPRSIEAIALPMDCAPRIQRRQYSRRIAHARWLAVVADDSRHRAHRPQRHPEQSICVRRWSSNLFWWTEECSRDPMACSIQGRGRINGNCNIRR